MKASESERKFPRLASRLKISEEVTDGGGGNEGGGVGGGRYGPGMAVQNRSNILSGDVSACK